MLENRFTTMLEWIEPWPARGPEGNLLDANVVLSATVHDCINLSRASAFSAGRSTTGKDIEHLQDFIVIHWARESILQREKYVPFLERLTPIQLKKLRKGMAKIRRSFESRMKEEETQMQQIIVYCLYIMGSLCFLAGSALSLWKLLR